MPRPAGDGSGGWDGAGRMVGELLSAAEARAEARRRAEAEREAKERARREREAAAARAVYLDGLAGQEEELWRRVESLIEVKRPKEYDQAVELLKDLRDLSARQQVSAALEARLADLRARHPKKPGLLSRLAAAGL